MATNFIASSDFNRISTVRLPFLWASMMASRTSAGVITFFPPTSRMMSPALKPCSDASPLGSTSVTTTPSELLPATCPAGARYVGASRGGLRHRGARFPLLRQFTDRERDALLLTLAPHGKLHVRTRSHGADLPGEITGILDGVTVDGGDHIAGEDAGFRGGAVRLRLGDERAFGSFHAEALGDVGGDRLNLHAEPTAADHALVLELGDD